MRRVESTVDQSPESMEKGESSLSQQAGDLLGRGANTLSTNADRAEASKALTKDGTLPDFQLDMGTDSTSPSSTSKGASGDKPDRDQFDPTPETKGDSGSSSIRDQSNLNPEKADALPASIADSLGDSATTPVSGNVDSATIEGNFSSSDASPDSFDSSASASAPPSGDSVNSAVGTSEQPSAFGTASNTAAPGLSDSGSLNNAAPNSLEIPLAR